MVLQISALVLVLAITFINSMYGLFSGLINTVCTIISMVVAFGFFEPLSEWLAGTIGGGTAATYAAPVVLVMLFVLTLLTLRLVADNTIRGNVSIPPLVDWLGGAALGFVTAQITVGVLLLGFLLLPFGPRVAMYSRFERDEDQTNKFAAFRRVDFWTRSDAFAAGMFSLLSSGSLSGATPFDTVYPDFPKWVSWTGNTVQEESWTAPRKDDKSGDGYKDGIKVLAWWEGVSEQEGRYRQEMPTRTNPDPAYRREQYTPASGNRLLGARLEFGAGASDGPDRGGSHRFRPTMLRVVGTEPGVGPEPVYRDYPVRLLRGADSKIQDAYRIADMDNNFAFGGGGSDQLDVYFEVPQDFKPEFVEYRRFARATFESPARVDAAPTAPLGGALASATPSAGSGGGSGSASGGSSSSGGGTQASGIMRFADVGNESRSGVRYELPFPLNETRLPQADVTVRNQKFMSGRLAGPRDSFTAEEGIIIREFGAPEGMAMVQFTIRARKAASLAGGVFNFVGATTNQYRVIDTAANQYPLAGYAGYTKRNGRDQLEIFYVGDDEELKASFRGMLDFKTLTSQDLRDSDDTEITLIFLVPRGVTIVRLENQSGQGTEGFRYQVPK
jgi:hypothetical protein